MTKWVTTDIDHRERYHTDKNCPHFPDEAVKLSEIRERRDLVICRQCAGGQMAAKLEEIGKAYESR